MENDEQLEVSDELQDDEVSEENYEAVSLEDLQTLNMNIATGFLGVTGSLGIIAGCIVCMIFKDILKK